jgi:hypothetical protein
MNRRYTAIVVALFAIAALEFGLLGANAAGITGGGGGELPPIGQRLGIPATDTPVATATPLSQFHPPPVDLTGAFLQANPLTIRCDGSEDSTVTVRALQPNGDPAPDGTSIFPAAYNGNASPSVAYTHDGYATFSVRFYSDIFPSGPNFIIRSGLLEAGIRIRCNPNSNVSDCVSFSPPACATPTPRPNCFGSPPQASPPCPPTPTPYPCNPSPNSGPLSPPCPTAQPCGISPPSVSPPCNPAPAFELAVDCDVDESGVQAYCLIPVGKPRDVGIVLRNNSGTDAKLAAFNFTVLNSIFPMLVPLPSTGGPPGLDGNPDFNQSTLAGAGWQCDPVLADTTPIGLDNDSLISCFNPQLQNAQVLPSGSAITLAMVHYADATVSLEPPASSLVLSLRDVNLYDDLINELGSCAPLTTVEATCTPATLEIATVSTPTASATTPARTATPPVVSTATRAPRTPTAAATRPARTSTPPAVTATRPPRSATVVPRTPTVAPQPTRRPSNRCADVNGDGKVSIRDVKLIANAVLRRDKNAQFDVNGDGRVSLRDVVRAISQLGRRC